MIVKSHTINTTSRSEKIAIIPMGDLHLGFKYIDKEKLQGFVDVIRKEKNFYWIGMGDYCECINLSDVRFDSAVLDSFCIKKLDDLPKAQATEFIKFVNPIRHKCLGLLTGNHEDLIRRKYHQDIMGYICTDLGVPCLSSTALIKIYFKRRTAQKTITIFAMHGFGGTRTETASLMKIMKKGNEFDADIYLMGHDHFKITHTKTKIIVYGGKEGYAQAVKKIFAVTGTFKQNYGDGEKSDWAERMSYPPTSTGAVKITIEPWRTVTINKKVIEQYPHIHISE